MKTITLLLLFLTTSLFAQTKLDNGIYQGFKFPFLNCLLNVKDSVTTIDVFFCNTGHYYGYIPTRILITPENPITEKDLILTYKNDSAKVYQAGSKTKIRIAGHGFVKMHLTNYNDSIITSSINNHLDFHCYHSLLHELKHKPKFNSKKFNEIYHSYNIHSYYSINTADFKKKLSQIETEERNNFH